MAQDLAKVNRPELTKEDILNIYNGLLENYNKNVELVDNNVKKGILNEEEGNARKKQYYVELIEKFMQAVQGK